MRKKKWVCINCNSERDLFQTPNNFNEKIKILFCPNCHGLTTQKRLN